MVSLLQKFLLAVQFIGFWAVVRTILYAVYRDWMNRGYKPNSEPRLNPGNLQGFDPSPHGGVFRFENGIALEVYFLAPDIIRTTWTPGKLPAPYALTHETLDETLSPISPQVYLATRKENGAQIFTTPALTLTVFPNGRLEYRNPTGQLLREEHVPERLGDAWLQSFTLHPSEHIYGLGERAAPLNLREGAYRFWNTDPAGSYGLGTDPLYVTIPVWIGKHEGGSYLVFYENSWEGEVEFSKIPGVPRSSQELKELEGIEGTYRHSRIAFAGGALRTYFIPGDLPHLTRRFSDLTGRAKLPPRWALGFHQSRWGYMNEGDIREVAAGFRERDLPLAAIHLDIDYMRGFRVFTVDESRFPDLGKLAGDLGAQGVKLVTIIDPGVKVDGQYDVYREGVAGGMFCEWDGKLVRSLVWPGWCAHPDFTRAKVREWWGGYYARLLDQGVAGIWHDMNEPATMAAWGELTLPRVTEHDLEGRGGGHVEAHNVYGMQMNRAGFEAMERYFRTPQDLHPSTALESGASVFKVQSRSAQDAKGGRNSGKRPWILSRSGWAGNQRYAWNWTGDTESSWAAMRMTIGQVLNLGLSGQPFTGPDIGGFSGEPGAELFVRWFQMAAFMPFFRVHSAKGTSPREPWVYGEDVVGICREFMKLRERLLPYLYTLAWEASQTGAPLNRPLFWLESDNPELWDTDDVFLLGDDLLIAPVLEPGAKLRRIPLTPDRWYNFWREDVLDESDFVESRVTLDRIPVLARGGSILPLAEGDGLTLHVYPNREGNACGVLYSDAGDGYGAGRVDRFVWAAGELTREEEGEVGWAWGEVRVEVHGE
ncbi:MAG: glycoside hydrolase family 31 protein [Anaerolineales bacterium]